MKSHFDYAIIGAGIAGITAAETIRSRDPEASIGIFSREEHRLYSRVILPSYAAGSLEREKLFLRKVGEYERNRIDFHPNTEISFVHAGKREIGLHDHTVCTYGKLLIASGGEVTASNLDELPSWRYRLHTLEDADRLREAYQGGRIMRPLIVGGSFIAFDLASISAAYQVPARILFRGPHFFSRIMGSSGGELVKRALSEHGFEFLPGSEIAEVAEAEKTLRITTSRMAEFESDALLVATGIRRSISFLAGSGIETGEGVKTNEFLEASAAGVYAAGDAAEYFDPIAQKHRVIGNWTNSFLQGKLAGLNMTGERLELKAVSSYTASSFGLAIAAIGDCSEGKSSIERPNFQKNSYERYVIEKGAVAGAVLINRNDLRAHASSLIETRTPMDAYSDRLRHSAFDIREIPVVKS